MQNKRTKKATTEVKPEATTEVKPEATTEVKPEATTEVKPEATTEVKPEATKPTFRTVKESRLPIKVIGYDIPELVKNDFGYTSEAKEIVTYSAIVGDKTYYITTNFDGAYYGYKLPELFERAKKNNGVISIVAKGGKEAAAAGYTENDVIDITNISTYSKRLLVYTKLFRIEIENEVYLYVVRNKGNYAYNVEKGFYIA